MVGVGGAQLLANLSPLKVVASFLGEYICLSKSLHSPDSSEHITDINQIPLSL